MYEGWMKDGGWMMMMNCATVVVKVVTILASFSQGCKNTFSLAGTFVNVSWWTINVPLISGSIKSWFEICSQVQVVAL